MSRDDSRKMHYTTCTKSHMTYQSLCGWSKPTQIWFVCVGWKRFLTNSTACYSSIHRWHNCSLTTQPFSLKIFTSLHSCFNTLFTESPVVPALFLMYECKFQTAHEQLFEIAASKVSALTWKSFPVVTDEERGIANAIKKHLPKAKRLCCWNHIFRGARYWCHHHNVKSAETQSFIADLRELFHKPTSRAMKQSSSNSQQVGAIQFFSILYEKYASRGVH